jgi:TonB family protein
MALVVAGCSGGGQTENNAESRPEEESASSGGGSEGTTERGATAHTAEDSAGNTISHVTTDAPLPAGVQEFRADPGYVDNTPDPDASELIAVDNDPICLNENEVKALIQYPQSARSEGVGGRVSLKLLVLPNGLVKSARNVVRRSPDARLTNAVFAVIPLLRFKPAFKGGQPVKCWVDFSYQF